MSLRDPVYIAEGRSRNHEIRPNRWWHPGDRRKAKRIAFILESLRHPAAREALQESGNRKERRGSRVTPGQLR